MTATKLFAQMEERTHRRLALTGGGRETPDMRLHFMAHGVGLAALAVACGSYVTVDGTPKGSGAASGSTHGSTTTRGGNTSGSGASADHGGSRSMPLNTLTNVAGFGGFGGLGGGDGSSSVGGFAGAGGAAGAGGGVASSINSICDPSLGPCLCINGQILHGCPAGETYCSAPGTFYGLPDGGCTTACPVPMDTVNPTSFDQSCAQDTDCWPVSLVCACCESAAINVNAADAYQAAVTAALRATPPLSVSFCSCGRTPTPTCQDGVCVMGGP